MPTARLGRRMGAGSAPAWECRWDALPLMCPPWQESGGWHRPTSPLAWTTAARHLPGAPGLVVYPPPYLWSRNNYGNNVATTTSKKVTCRKTQGVFWVF